MKPIDMTEIYKKYSGKWIAMDDNDHVITFGNSLEEVYEKAQKKGCENPFVNHIPDPKYGYVM